MILEYNQRESISFDVDMTAKSGTIVAIKYSPSSTVLTIKRPNGSFENEIFYLRTKGKNYLENLNKKIEEHKKNWNDSLSFSPNLLEKI